MNIKDHQPTLPLWHNWLVYDCFNGQNTCYGTSWHIVVDKIKVNL